jgi:hypothetical protein
MSTLHNRRWRRQPTPTTRRTPPCSSTQSGRSCSICPRAAPSPLLSSQAMARSPRWTCWATIWRSERSWCSGEVRRRQRSQQQQQQQQQQGQGHCCRSAPQHGMPLLARRAGCVASCKGVGHLLRPQHTTPSSIVQPHALLCCPASPGNAARAARVPLLDAVHTPLAQRWASARRSRWRAPQQHRSTCCAAPAPRTWRAAGRTPRCRRCCCTCLTRGQRQRTPPPT